MQVNDTYFVNSEKWTLKRESEYFYIYSVHILMEDALGLCDFPDFIRVISKKTNVSKNFKSYLSASDYVHYFEEGLCYARKEN